MNKTVRLAGIAYESLVNGPGMRRVFFAQGCKHKCEGCFNPETHSFDGGEIMDMDKLIKDVLDNPMLKGVTFSGGDPIEQAHSFAMIGALMVIISLMFLFYMGSSLVSSTKKYLEQIQGIEITCIDTDE